MKNEKDIEKSVFSDKPKDMTPVKQDYSPGLGDRMDAVSYTIGFGWLGLHPGYKVVTTYEQALEIQRKVRNITNGTHQICYVLGQDKLRWGTSPYLIEDTEPPMGDGTPGSGYRKYREFVRASMKNDAVAAQIIEPLLAGQHRNEVATGEEVIPPSCYTHTEDKNTKVGWEAGDEAWDLLSLHNLYKTGYAQKAWRRMMDNWNYRTHLYYDAMIPVPEGLYNNPNLTTEFGGEITDTEMEWDAVQKEIKYSWENFAISSGEEYIHPKYKGLSVYFSVPYGNVTNDDYLNLWQNSMVICNRGSESMNMAWGSEDCSNEDAFQFNGETQPWDAFVVRMMEHNFQYLYMLERKPESYKEDDEIHQVTFSGGLVSTFNKKNGYYTLIENGNFIVADGGDRFIPQVGAGCKIFVYTRDGKTRTWKLPETWDGIAEADLYLLSTENGAAKVATLAVTAGCVTVETEAAKPYVLVPKGNVPMPVTATFDDLNAGDTLAEYQGIGFNVPNNPAFKVYGASARGGFGSPSVYADSSGKTVTAGIGLASGAILHSFKVGNKGGEGKIVLHSSNPMNPDVTITLPETDCVYKFNTAWKYGETDKVSVTVENSEGVNNVLMDTVMYSLTVAD